MLTDDTKIQTLLATLEEDFENRDPGEKYIVKYTETALPDGEHNREYAGAICVEGERDTEWHYVVEVAQVSGEDRAKTICAAVNAIPQLLDYIRQLEARV